MASPLRVGLIGAGANTRLRHIPGLRALPNVEITAVCNRRPASTRSVAREFGIPHVHEHWQHLLESDEIDAVVVGTWPYLHCAITLAALEAGKHVLTEARLCMNASEAHEMLRASLRWPQLVTQVVPSPYGLKGHFVMTELLASGYLGELREASIVSANDALADAAAPLSWRQDSALSGFNMLSLGIVHETFTRWAPPPVRVVAQVQAFIPSRIDPESGVRRRVGTPDSVQVLAALENGSRALYQVSGVLPFGKGAAIRLYGSEGALHYDLLEDRIWGAARSAGAAAGAALTEIPIPDEKRGGWRVEAEWVGAIREGTPVQFTDFRTGVAYMEFTEAVAQSAERGEAVELPLSEHRDLREDAD